MRQALIDAILVKAQQDPKLVFLTGDLGFMAVEPIRDVLGERFINAGLAEANMIGVAAGLAREGYKPIVYSMAPFITFRCLEQIRVNLCQNEYKALLIGVGAGYSYGNQGASHHSIEDLSIMNAMPNISVYTPADAKDVESIISNFDEIEGSAYVRIAKNDDRFSPLNYVAGNISKVQQIAAGSTCAILCHGSIAKKCEGVARELSSTLNIHISVYHFNCLDPIDRVGLRSILGNYSDILTVEQHVELGGLSSIVALEIAKDVSRSAQLHTLTIASEFKKVCGDTEYLEAIDGLSYDGIKEKVCTILGVHQ